jgi:hypothetical protein
VRQLNRRDRKSLDFEWELLLLSWFFKFGDVVHERSFSGSSRPDLYSQLRDQTNIEFIADITTVSDEWLENQNPYEFFTEQFHRLLKKFGLSPGGFRFRVE